MRQLKLMIVGITTVEPENQMQYSDEECVDGSKPLTKYGLNNSTTKAQAPATIRRAFRYPGSAKLDTLQATLLFIPLQLPDVMKPPQYETDTCELWLHHGSETIKCLRRVLPPTNANLRLYA